MKAYNIRELQCIRNTWIDIDEIVVPEEKRELFRQQKRAVNMYIDGYSLNDISKNTGIIVQNILRLVNRCMKQKMNGEYFGYEALIPNKRLQETKSKDDSFSGLLKKYPSLKEFIYGNYTGDKKYTLEKNMSIITLHGKLLTECAKLGVTETEYPFNTTNKAYVSLTKYIRNVVKKDITGQAKRESKDARQKLNSTGIGTRYTKNAAVPFQSVQADGHIIDLLYTVEIENEDGTVEKRVATRAWLLAIIDVATRCILGYSISQEYNYNQYDLIDAVINSIKPKELMKLTIDGLNYPDNGGYYSLVYPQLNNVLFDEIMLDNAKAHLSEYTTQKISTELNCVVNFGSVATPETRGIVERFFGSLETRGFHKLPMTTGSSINDSKRHNPEETALKYNITYEQICELMDVLIAEYNNTPHSGIRNLTPLESMKAKIDAGLTPSLAKEEQLPSIDKLRLRYAERIVRGKTENGKRPYISFEGSEYRSRELSISGAYLGEKITILYDPRDISTVEAYTENGSYIGTLRARGEFGTKSHSLKTRKNANKLARERGRAKVPFDTPITAYETYLNKSGKSSRRDATKADIVRREQGAEKYSEIKSSEIVPVSDDVKKQDCTYENLKDLSFEEVYKKLFGKEA